MFAKSYMAQLVPAVFGTLNVTGYFYDPVERGVWVAYSYYGHCSTLITRLTQHLTPAPPYIDLNARFPRAEVERYFIPWLMDATVDRVSHELTSHLVLDSIIRQATQERMRSYEATLQRRDEFKRGMQLAVFKLIFIYKIWYKRLVHIIIFILNRSTPKEARTDPASLCGGKLSNI